MERTGVSSMRIVVYELKNDKAAMSRLGWINNATGNYVDAKYQIGSFNLNVPATRNNIEMISEDRIFYIDDFYWGTVTGFKFEDDSQKRIIVIGKQLTCWLNRRLILPPIEYVNASDDWCNYRVITSSDQKEDVNVQNQNNSPMGYEAVKGSTETIMKYAVQNHMVNPVEEARKIYGLKIARDLERGNPDDAYMYRYVPLDTAIFTVGKAAKLGAKISGNPNKCEFVFDVISQTDRTDGQSNNVPLILQVLRGNLESSGYTYDESDSYNTFYCIRSDSSEVWEQFIQTYHLDEVKKSGLQRRETSLTISVDSDSDNEYSEFAMMSKKEMENYRPIENLQAVMSRKLQYRKDYNLGDIATVILAFANVKADMEIVSVETTVSENNTVRVATFGEEKISKFKLLQRRMSK